MTALAQDRKTDKIDTDDTVEVRLMAFPVAANTQLFGGGLAALDASGNCVPASALAALKIVGRIERGVNNLNTNTPYGAAGAQTVIVRRGSFNFNQGTGANAITAANFGAPVFASDDNTVNLTDNAGTWPFAGYVIGVPTATTVSVTVGMPSPFALNPELVPSTAAFRARNIGSVGANVVLATGYTVNSGNDGVTNVAGDIILLVSQTTAAQNGPYVVGTPVANVSPLTRPDWWPTGAVYKTGTQIKVGGEGTVYKNTVWQAMLAADTFTVDTSDGKLYPLQVSGQTALAAGTFTLSVPVFSAKSEVQLTRVAIGGTITTTIMYVPSVSAGTTGITPGVIGTGAVVVTAQVAAGNATQASDTSTLNWTVTNQP